MAERRGAAARKSADDEAPKTEEKKPGPVQGDGSWAERKCISCAKPILAHAPSCEAIMPTKLEEKATPEQLEARGEARVYKSHDSRTCIALRRRPPQTRPGQQQMVDFVPHVDGPFQFLSLKSEEFDAQWKEIVGYDAGRAARLYVGYAQYFGATERAMDELGRLTSIKQHDKEKAMAKRPGVATATKVEDEKSGKGAEVAAERSKLARDQAKPKAAATGEAKKDAGPRRSAASACKELIREGKLPDSEIFEKVAKEFPGFKRNYVPWYRNDMKKKGEKPPDPVQK